MTNRDAPSPAAGRLRSLIRPALLIAYFALAVAGKFDRLEGWGLLQFSGVGLIAALIIFEIAQLVKKSEDEPAGRFWLPLWMMLGLRLGLQATGAVDSRLYPLSYLLFAALFAAMPARNSLILAALFLALEAGWCFLTARPAPPWSLLVGHAGFLGAFSAAAFLFARFERKAKRQAEHILSGMEDKLSEFQKDDTVHRMAGLSEGGREKAALRSVAALDQSFYSTLATARGLLSAETCALYWRGGPAEKLRLRELSSSREQLNAEGEVAPGHGLLGLALEQGRPVRASGSRRLMNSIPYYNSGEAAEHLLAVPFGEAGRLQGLVVADRREGPPFSEADEKLLAAIAHELSEIHDHALLLRRTEAESAQFRSLAELSHRLSRTLDQGEIMDAVIRVSHALAGHDAAAVLLPGAGKGELVIKRAGGAIGAEVQGEPIKEAGTLVGWVITEKQYLVIPDLRDRSVKTPVLEKRRDPPEMRSVLIHPLPLRNHARGALAFFAREPGAFSPYVVRATGILADLAAVAIQNSFLYQEMEKRAVSDGLTGLYNHRWFQERLAEEIERAGRLGTRLALLMCDLDHFKKINDAYGHPVGDQVLSSVAQLLKAGIRRVDSAARYGGEEFALILVGASESGALELAERLRKQVAKLLFPAGDQEFRVSISIGLSVYPDHARGKEELIESADQALYQAKHTGRNRIVCALMPATASVAPLRKVQII